MGRDTKGRHESTEEIQFSAGKDVGFSRESDEKVT
jgi:hypothetical protein